ncbi:MAG TPA: hypothetical protein PLS63_00950 [Microthrixaceae bacterium]|nr:hypothetical protein [Microthrixaceae bacterium]
MEPTRPRRRLRTMLALPAAVAALGLATASAASLGGITSSSYGADVGVVSSCDTDGVTVAFTNGYDATLGRYQTTAVTVSGIAAACASKALALTLKDGSGASLGTGSVASISGTSAVVPIGGVGANANAVVGTAIVISG